MFLLLHFDDSSKVCNKFVIYIIEENNVYFSHGEEKTFSYRATFRIKILWVKLRFTIKDCITFQKSDFLDIHQKFI